MAASGKFPRGPDVLAVKYYASLTCYAIHDVFEPDLSIDKHPYVDS